MRLKALWHNTVYTHMVVRDPDSTREVMFVVPRLLFRPFVGVHRYRFFSRTSVLDEWTSYDTPLKAAQAVGLMTDRQEPGYEETPPLCPGCGNPISDGGHGMSEYGGCV